MGIDRELSVARKGERLERVQRFVLADIIRSFGKRLHVVLGGKE